MGATQTFTGTLTVFDCPQCGMVFGITAAFEVLRRTDHQTFYCPAKHPMGYGDRTALEKERDRLTERLRVTERSERFYRDQVALERRRAAAQKGQRTRVLNLITRGICPVAGCRRNFSNVREHMVTQHPDFHTHEDRS